MGTDDKAAARCWPLGYAGIGTDTPGAGSLRAYVEDPSIDEGQRSRLLLFESVEQGVCERVEEMCSSSSIDVVDVAVLVLSPGARELLFQTDAPPCPGVLLGHRLKVHELLGGSLPATDGGPGEPYADLLEPAPPRCVRVLILDGESLTVMSYGTFVTVRLDDELPKA